MKPEYKHMGIPFDPELPADIAGVQEKLARVLKRTVKEGEAVRFAINAIAHMTVDIRVLCAPLVDAELRRKLGDKQEGALAGETTPKPATVEA
jgi:hypothetical protein